jgi:ankyrin repeat protein
MVAARNGHSEVVKLLLAQDADPNLTTDAGATALRWALREQHVDIVQLLRKVGARD